MLARFDIPYLIATTGVENVASRRVLIKSGYDFVDVRALDVHITGGRYDFAYYRRYRPEIVPLEEEYRGAKLEDAIETDRVYAVSAHETDSGFTFTLTETKLDAPRAFPYRAELLEDWLEHPTLVGAKLNDKLAGYAEGFLETWNNRYRITNLFIEPAFRWHGAGRTLLHAMIEVARREGARAIALETQSFNFPAISLYQSCGFRFIGIDTTAYANGDIDNHNVRIEMGMPL